MSFTHSSTHCGVVLHANDNSPCSCWATDSREAGRSERALGTVRERFVFVGGCATGLLVTDVAAAPVRATVDVDVIVEVLTLADYHALERELEQAGITHDQSPGAPICRWIIRECLLDVMPTCQIPLKEKRR